MKEILKLDHIQKYYGNGGNVTKAIQDISFSVQEGEFVGIMGASGSGKTTLLNCISTIDTVSAGHIYLDGTDVTEINEKQIARFRRENLGFVFQDFNLLDTLTISENIALALTINKVPAGEIDGRVLEMAGKLNITDILDKYPYQVSGGQKQRCACARAIINQPKLILADEPIPIFSIAELEKAYFLGFDAPTLNQYLLFGVADILFIISAVIYLSNAALLYWKESKVSRKYHNTSLFLFGQLSSKLATNTKTMTIICVTLTFSICLFVIAPVLTGWSLGYLDSRAVYDIQISSRYNDVYEVENLPDTDYGEITAFIEQNNIAIKEDLTFSEYLPQKSDFHQRVKYDFPPLAIALKDYNAVRKMLGYEPIILQTDEFATHWHRAAEDKDIENYIAEHTLLETDAGTLKLSENAVFQEPVGESIYNLYTDVVYIIPDEIAQVLLPVQSNRFVMTQYPLPFKTAEMLEQLLGRSYPEDPDKENLAGYSTTVHTTEVNRIIALNFILKASLIYGAIVLMVMCLTVLALQQLLDAEKNNYRFSVLRKMGVEEKDLHTLVLKQLGVWFGMPITAAIVVAIIVIGYFLQSISAEISAYIGCGALMRQIGIIVGIFALLLSCYFLSTWLLFQRSIRSNSDSVR